MSILRIESASPPFDEPGLGVRAARLLGLAEAMGLLDPEQPIDRLDRSTVQALLARLASAGIGRDLAWRIRSAGDTDKLARLLDAFYAHLVESPLPETEIPMLLTVLGHELLGTLCGASPSSLRRYAARLRSTPDDIAARVHLLARIVAELAGGYNDYGVRRWFVRPRAQLDGRSPADILSGSWDPDGDDIHTVHQLAAALNASVAA